MTRFAVVVLAAGGSTRLGTSKQLLPIDGVPLIRRATLAAVDAGAQQVIVVLGSGAALCRAELAGLPVTIVTNEDWASGMGSSLRTGIAAVPDAIDAVVMTLVDQPAVSASVIAGLARAHDESGTPIVASAYAGTCGVPALFARSLFEELREVRGDAGARSVIRADPSRVHVIPFPAGAEDLDTAQDVASRGHRDQDID